MIDKATVAQLHKIYERRAWLQKCREFAADRNTWVSIVEKSFGGTGTLSCIKEGVGGSAALQTVLMQATVDAIEALQQSCDKDIEELGGEA